MTRSTKLAISLARSTVSFSSTFTEELCVATCRAIKNLLACDGYSVAGHEREQTSIDNIVDLFCHVSDSEAVKLVKYLTAIYLPMLLGDELPSRPDFLSPVATLFSGEYGRYIKRLFQCEPKRPSRRAISLATSILQIKRYLPPLSKRLKLEAIRGCKERLTAVRVTPIEVLQHIERVTDSLFPISWDHRPGPWSVTNKSCFESSRAAGGAQEFMFKEAHPLHLVRPLRTKKSTLELIKETIDRLEGRVTTPTKATKEPFRIPPTQSLDYDLVSMDASGELRGHPLRVISEEYKRVALETLPSQLQAKMEIVEDPLKARVITKNNWQCTILKPLQKMIHSRLKQIPMFELIGKQISSEVIASIPLFEGSKWVSGDYEAATDNLNADCTKAALDVILSNMRGPLSKQHDFMYLASRSLTNLSIFHEEVGWFTQSNGQLMGSLLSFPILCLINYAMWHFTAWKHYRVFPSGVFASGKWDTVRVNGDDIAFPCTPEFYECWKANVLLTGLKPSLGKNYFSDRMVTLNSQPFVMSNDETGHAHVSQVRWLNQGLLKEPSDDEEVSPLESLGSMHDDFVRGAEDKRYASGIFIKEHQKILKTTFRNLFGPREYGGLGAHPIKGTKGVDAEAYDLRQLYVAKLLKEKKIKLPSHSASTQYTQYIESYVKHKFPTLVQGNLKEIDLAPLGYRWEDVTERVEECRVDLLSATAWLGPLLVRRRDVNDHHFLRDLLKQVPKVCKLEGLPWDDYMSFPEESALYQLMHEVEGTDLTVTFNEEVALGLPELLGLPRNENGECDEK